MTSTREVELSYHIYKLSFLNFLLGKQPCGPGQFMFGWVVVGDSEDLFPIDYSASCGEEVIEKGNHVSDELLDETASRKSVFV